MGIQIQDEIYMQRCIGLATNGLGSVAPNPMVGSVIVYKNKIIGEGYHREYGNTHAEVNAINSVKEKNHLPNSTIYINLEPCSHFGKTPPCTDLILQKKIPRIIIGTPDPNPLVAGKGIQKLKNEGCKVITGILEKECRNLNKRFFTFYENKRPYIILKWAETSDGFIDINRNYKDNIHPPWITDEESRTLVHKWRSEEQSIMVGTNTIELDNPQLNTRNWPGKNPVRIVIDRKLRLHNKYHVFNKTIPTIVFTEQIKSSESNLEYIKINFSKNLLQEMLNVLYEKSIQSILVEGGAKLINTFIKNNLWDEARVFIGQKNFISGVKAPDINNQEYTEYSIGTSKLYQYINTKAC